MSRQISPEFLPTIKESYFMLQSPPHTHKEIDMALHVVAVIIIALLMAWEARITTATATRVRKDDRTDYISTRCRLTTYPPLCRASLAPYAKKVNSNPEQLAHAAVSASLAQAKSALAAISSMAESVAPLKPGESMVLSDCLMTMRDSVQKLQKSQDEMGGVRGGKAWVENARTWVSAALTEDNMCADELQGVGLGGKRDEVRGQVLRAARLTSNALALISSLASSP